MNERSFIRMSHIQQPENIARVTKKCKTNDLERRPKLNLVEEKKGKKRCIRESQNINTFEKCIIMLVVCLPCIPSYDQKCASTRDEKSFFF